MGKIVVDVRADGIPDPTSPRFAEGQACCCKRFKLSLGDLPGEFIPLIHPIHVALSEAVAEEKHEFGETKAPNRARDGQRPVKRQ